MEKIVLEAHDLTVSYHSKPVLWSVDFSLPQGVLTGIVGPNGAGKSTLLKTILGLTEHTGGYVEIFGEKLDSVRKRISYVPQKETVDWNFPASVYDVVMMGRYGKLGLFKRPQKADTDIVNQAIQDVGMEGFKDRQIAQLSGGQQQRVFLARALAQQADLYIMDEPFAGVDATTEKAIIQLLHKLRDQGKSVIVVHHDLQTVNKYFDWIILLNQILVACGPVSTTFTSENLKKTYGGKLTFLNQIAEVMGNNNLNMTDKSS